MKIRKMIAGILCGTLATGMVFAQKSNAKSSKKQKSQSEETTVEEKPKALTQLLECARVLSTGIRFVRADFYIVEDKVLFGELTFYPQNGFEKYDPPQFDLWMGNLLEL